MKIKFEVEIELEHRTGKFAAREDLVEKLMDALDSANPNEVTGDNDGEYEVSSWDVTEV